MDERVAVAPIRFLTERQVFGARWTAPTGRQPGVGGRGPKGGRADRQAAGQPDVGGVGVRSQSAGHGPDSSRGSLEGREQLGHSAPAGNLKAFPSGHPSDHPVLTGTRARTWSVVWRATPKPVILAGKAIGGAFSAFWVRAASGRLFHRVLPNPRAKAS